MKRLVLLILVSFLLIPAPCLSETYEEFEKLKAADEKPKFVPKGEPELIPKDVIIRELRKPMPQGQVATVVFSSECILFDYGSARIRESSYRQLREIAAALTDSALAGIPYFFVDGHTCSIGSNANNCRLSWRRANSVVRQLRRFGVPPNKLVARGFGECCPIATNDAEYGRRLNRRVVLKSGAVILKKDQANKCPMMD